MSYYDMIIRMLKIRDESICKPLEISFGHVQKMESSPQNRKKSLVVPVFRKKKNNSKELKNDRSIYLLSVSCSIFEILLYGSIFKFFTGNSLISQKHSGVKPGNSYTNQLLSITHQNYKSFYDGYEVQSVFLDISSSR